LAARKKATDDPSSGSVRHTAEQAQALWIFEWNQEQQNFRAEVRAFLADNLPDNWEELAHGPGSAAQTEFSKKFCGALADAGLLVAPLAARVGWPGSGPLDLVHPRRGDVGGR